jgi:hypothetical protein
MKFLMAILRQISGISKPRIKFMATLLKTIIAMPGNVTFRNLSRFSSYSEKTFSRNFRKSFDFVQFNLLMLKTLIDRTSQLILAVDASFIDKSGKNTYGLGRFYNGAKQRTEKGLEIFLISIVDPILRTAFSVLACQTPPTLTNNETRVDYYAKCLKDISLRLPKKILYIVADGFFAKIKFVEAVLSIHLDCISKLRSDANLKTLYKGQQNKRGRHKKFEDKLKFDDLSKFDFVADLNDDKLSIFTTLAYCVNLKRIIRICLVVNNKAKNDFAYAVLFSTNTEQDAFEIYYFYKSRFQIEFIFRDAKQFTGLCDCQATKKEALDFHFNSSLAALNFAKFTALENHKFKKEFSFSMATIKRTAFNEIFMENIFSKLGFDLSWIYSKSIFKELILYGAIAA